MTQKELLDYLASIILKKQKNAPIFVGIDGVDAAGKTTLADKLVKELEGSSRLIIRASIDSFHNPRHIRYSKGENSSEGYYFDSFNYKAMVKVLLDPLSSGKLKYQTAIFDYKTDSKIILPVQTATNNAILVMDGIFLFRPELVNYWDIKIFIDVDFKITLKRVIKRSDEVLYLGTEQDIINKYNQRYIPGQQIYFEQANPKEKADIIIDNSDFQNPVIKRGGCQF
ncbi:MAG: hypothetical protein AABX52_00555 [Nanoarchaeota archaeon]